LRFEEELQENNRDFVASFEGADLPRPPAKQLAVVACMDARLDVLGALGLRPGDAHIIRNAGGVVTDDVIRSLVVSQRLLATRRIAILMHTDCGMATFSDDSLKKDIEDELGLRPAFSFETFTDTETEVKQSIKRIQTSPFIPHREEVAGFIYRVDSGEIVEVPV